MISKNVSTMVVQKTPLQKSYKLKVGAQNFTIDFKTAVRRFV